MTTKTVTRQDWLHVLIEIEVTRSCATTTDNSAQNDRHQNQRESQFRISTRFMISLADTPSSRDTRFHNWISGPTDQYIVWRNFTMTRGKIRTPPGLALSANVRVRIVPGRYERESGN
jgi:hypothetical protein